MLKAPSGIAVMAVIICLAMAWASNLAGLSYAVGAFFAGIAVSNSDYAEDADRYIEPVGDTLFVPVFFVGIGLQTTGVDDTKMIVFIAIMTVLGVITKVVGCGLGGRMAGFGGALTRIWTKSPMTDHLLKQVKNHLILHHKAPRISTEKSKLLHFDYSPCTLGRIMVY